MYSENIIGLSIGALLLVSGLSVIFLRTIWFHRDPKRAPDEIEDVLISPADGMIVYTRRFENGVVVSEKLGEQIPITEVLHSEQPQGSGWMLGIYMSPLDVHFNYAPSQATVQAINRKEASLNLPMLDMWEYVKIVWFRRLVQLFGRRFHLENERCTIFFKNHALTFAVVLIADKFVSKIKTFVSPGDTVSCGGKLAFISRGSQADVVIFRDDIQLVVHPGQHVTGGQTVIARIGQALQ